MGGAEVAGPVVSVVEVPGLTALDQLAAAAAAGLARRDEWLELATAGDMCVGVAAGVPAQPAFVLGRAHARKGTLWAVIAEPTMTSGEIRRRAAASPTVKRLLTAS